MNKPEIEATNRERPPALAAAPCSASSVMQQGGEWLAAARTWLQWNTDNGDSVEWGSNDVIRPALTVRQIEELAAAVVASERNSRQRPNNGGQR